MDSNVFTAKIMEFNNPIFHKGLNCTVRYGDKWKNLKIGEKVIISSHLPFITTAFNVKKLLVCQFYDLKREDIICEHDLNCRTLIGLFNTLKTIYPQMHKSSIVTVIYFDNNET